MVTDDTLVYDKPLMRPDGETPAVTETQHDSSTVLFLDPESLTETHQIG